MYYSAIGLLAILILLIENQDILLNRGAARVRPAWQAYRHFLFAVLAYYVTDTLWGALEAELRARERSGQGRLTVGPDVLAFAPERPHRRETEALFGLVWRGVAAIAAEYPAFVRAER